MHRQIKILKPNEIPFREVVEGMSDIILATDREGRFIYVSPSVKNYLGYTPSELIGKYTKDFVHPDDYSKARKRALDIVNEELPITEYRIRDKKGEYRWFRSFSKILYEDNKVIGRYGVMNDITDIKNANIKLRERELRYRNIFDNLIDVYVETRFDGTILEISPSVERLMGFTREEMLGTSGLVHYVNIEDRIRHVKSLQKEGQSSNYDLFLYHKDGTKIPVAVTSQIKKDDQGQEYIISMVRDESQRKETELLLQESENRLRQVQRMEAIGNLAGGIAHDFNNILFPITGMAELLMEDIPSDSYLYDNVREILNAGKRGSDLVKQILAFSRQSEHRLIPIRIQQVLKEVLKLSRSTIPTYINIIEDIQTDCGMIFGDSTQIHQVAMNIITNAYHALEQDGGEIKVRLDEVVLKKDDLKDSSLIPGQYARLSIQDNGCGMSEKLMKNIFEPYYTTKEKGKGTGLGLAVVHGIIKEHKGDIIVKSVIGKGSKFSAYFPVLNKPAEIATQNAKKSIPTGKERILLVDDEDSVVKLEKIMLERLGYKVNAQISSIAALELFKEMPDSFDLVISDMTMPQMTGDQLLYEIKNIRSDIPVIICTGFSERINQNKALEIGVDGFLMKPLIKKDLAKMVRKVLD